jgi:hypothetical protein
MPYSGALAMAVSQDFGMGPGYLLRLLTDLAFIWRPAFSLTTSSR